MVVSTSLIINPTEHQESNAPEQQEGNAPEQQLVVQQEGNTSEVCKCNMYNLSLILGFRLT